MQNDWLKSTTYTLLSSDNECHLLRDAVSGRSYSIVPLKKDHHSKDISMYPPSKKSDQNKIYTQRPHIGWDMVVQYQIYFLQFWIIEYYYEDNNSGENLKRCRRIKNNFSKKKTKKKIQNRLISDSKTNRRPNLHDHRLYF